MDIPGFPGEEIDRRLLADVRWMKRRYHIFITDGYSTDPAHARNGEHPIGLAADIVPNRDKGGTWSDLGALARKAEPRAGPARSRPGAGWAGTAIRITGAATTYTSRGCTPRPSRRTRPASSTPASARSRSRSRRPRPSRSRGRAASRPTAFRRSSTGGTAAPHLPRRLRVKLAPKVRPRSTERAGPCSPPSRAVPGRSRRGWLEPGRSAAHARYRLRLLPSGSDLVRGRALRGTWPSTPPATYRPRRPRPSDGRSAPLERIAGDRAPLPPRLARSTGHPTRTSRLGASIPNRSAPSGRRGR